MFSSVGIRIIIAVLSTAILAFLLVTYDAFELLHEFTRSHESWELDEIILTVIATLIVAPIWVAYELKVSHDQVKAKAAEQLALEQELNEARRGQTMGSLAGGMAHSGNNMLQAILTLGRTLQNRMPADNPNQKIVAKIIHTAVQTSDIFASVLQLSRSEKRSKATIDLGDCLMRNKGVLGTTVASNIDIEFHKVETGVQVPISEAECTDIMLVLLSNASDSYSGKPGKISIDVTIDPSNRDKLLLSIADHGSGIPTDVQPHICDAFYTTKPVGTGTGIGLSIVKRIVERAGGTLSFTSIVNGGTTFVIHLPIAGGR